MNPAYASPLGASAFATLALLLVGAFTLAQILLTVPHIRIDTPRQARILAERDYAGIISWVSQDSIRITDPMGVTREFAFDESTTIQSDTAATQKATWKNLHVFDHALIHALEDGAGSIAQVVRVSSR